MAAEVARGQYIGERRVTLQQAVKRLGMAERTVKKYLRDGLIPEHLAWRQGTGRLKTKWIITEDALPWFERVLKHNLEKIHGCNPALWAVRKLESDRKRGLVE